MWNCDRCKFGITYDIGVYPQMSTTSLAEAINFVDVAKRDQFGNVWVTSRRGRSIVAGNYYRTTAQAKNMLRSGFYDGI